MNKTWIRVGQNNILESKENWYISYNPHTWAGVPLFHGDGEGEETALCGGTGHGDFYILNGDHRKAYEALIDKGWDVCKQYFSNHQNQKSSWSN